MKGIPLHTTGSGLFRFAVGNPPTRKRESYEVGERLSGLKGSAHTYAYTHHEKLSPNRLQAGETRALLWRDVSG